MSWTEVEKSLQFDFFPGLLYEEQENTVKRDMPMNTLFGYLYRDAGNYKFYYELVLPGILNSDQLAPFLHEGAYFIPSEVGLPDLQPDILTFDDHIWHEIDSIKHTAEAPTCDLSAASLAERFKIAKRNNWNEKVVLKNKGFVS